MSYMVEASDGAAFVGDAPASQADDLFMPQAPERHVLYSLFDTVVV